jgi:ATP-dependent protease HslVU (ClpYQ) peptidase subunit
MTVIAVKKYADKITISADSVATWGNYEYQTLVNNKILEIDKNYIVAGAGDWSQCNLFMHYASLHRPEHLTHVGIVDFFKNFDDWILNRINKRSDIGNSFLIILNSQIWYYTNYSANQIFDFFAIGSGWMPALTALHLGLSTHEAVQVACKMLPSCALPVVDFEIKIDNIG